MAPPKGFIPWNKGIKCSNETRSKISLSKKGKPASEKWLAKKSEIGLKISKAKTGKEFSLKHRESLSLARKQSSYPSFFKEGHKQFNTGKTHFKKGITPWNKGKEMPRGEKSPNWKGGNSKRYKEGYYSPEYKEWRKKVFERDQFTCQKCNAKGYLTAHHIKSWAKYPKLRFTVSNGITLCESCHTLIDKYRARFKRQSAAEPAEQEGSETSGE